MANKNDYKLVIIIWAHNFGHLVHLNITTNDQNSSFSYYKFISMDSKEIIMNFISATNLIIPFVVLTNNSII